MYFYLVKLFPTILSLLVVWNASSQELQGVVLNENQSAMPYVYIVNLTQQVSSLSADNGVFIIQAIPNDTIRMTFIGYKPLEIIVNENMILKQITSTMAPIDIILSSVWVFSNSDYRIPKRYKGIPMKIPGIAEPSTEPTPQVSFTPMVNDYYAPGVVISGALSYFTKENIEKRKAIEARIQTEKFITYAKLIELEAIRSELKSKFNLSDSELDRLLIVMNLNQPQIQELRGKKSIMSKVTAFLSSRTQGIVNFEH
ncbi:MAG: hypothetical protein CMB82_04365 [Flammeovirgaceae bacterium]|nr:hypothetical protein [Flammeovirgaceae bacterium]